MKQTVVIYTRVSTDKQTTDSQLASLREYCARHNWRDVQMITDTISGSKISRKGLDALMKAVGAGKVGNEVRKRCTRSHQGERSLKSGSLHEA